MREIARAPKALLPLPCSYPRGKSRYALYLLPKIPLNVRAKLLEGGVRTGGRNTGQAIVGGKYDNAQAVPWIVFERIGRDATPIGIVDTGGRRRGMVRWRLNGARDERVSAIGANDHARGLGEWRSARAAA